MRETLPLEAIKALTWGTLATEWLAVALILTPFFVHRARLVAVTLLPCLHSGFALGLHLGNFSWAMIAFYPLLLTPVHWRALERVGLRLGKRCDGLLPRPEPRLAALGRQLRRLVAGSRPPEASRPSPRWRQRRRMLSEAAVGVLMVAIATEIVNDNASVPRWMRVSQPAWAEAIVDYPRLLQGWRMFAPDVGKRDSMIYVDAVTAEGLHVDPYNEVASRQSFPKGDTVPPHMAQSQFFCMYSDRIAMRAYAAYRQAFLEWLLAYPKRTGRPADCLVSLTGYLVIDESPPPGSATRPTPIERIEFLSYTAPAGDACRLRGVGPVASRSD